MTLTVVCRVTRRRPPSNVTPTVTCESHKRRNHLGTWRFCVVDVIYAYLLLCNAAFVKFIPQVNANYRATLRQSAPCIIEGHLRTDRNWYGYLANVTVLGVARLTFEFVYPVERCCQNVLFYRQDQAAIVTARTNCWQKEDIVRLEEDQTLRLTPSFPWSGCHTASSTAAFNQDVSDGADFDERSRRQPSGINSGYRGSAPGAPSVLSDLYVCKGGRSFSSDETTNEPTTWYVAVSNCATLYGLDLSYVIEINGQIGECPNRGTRRQPAADYGPVVRPTVHTRVGGGSGTFPVPDGGGSGIVHKTSGSSDSVATPGKAILTAREASVVVQQQGDSGRHITADEVIGGKGNIGRRKAGAGPCIIEGSINTTRNWYGFFANLTLRGGDDYDDEYPGGSDVMESAMPVEGNGGATADPDVDDPTRPGWFRFTFTYPHRMQIQEVFIYEEDDLAKLHWEQDCWQKNAIIPSDMVEQKIIELSFRSTSSGCESQTVLYHDEPVNITCSGEKRFGSSLRYGSFYRHRPQSADTAARRRPLSSNVAGSIFSATPTSTVAPPRRIFLALSHCRSTVGLQLQYRLEVFGNVDPNMCTNSAENHRRPEVLWWSLIVAASVAFIADRLRRLPYRSLIL